MKLNNYQKEAIVRAIFQDVPVPSSEKIKVEVQKAIIKSMTPACQRAYKACPNALLKDSESYLTYERERLTFVVGDANFEEVIKPWREARNNYENARQALVGLINSCSTLKQLNEALPEFSSYFPSEMAPTKNLPAIANVVTDIVKLGWKPKETK